MTPALARTVARARRVMAVERLAVVLTPFLSAVAFVAALALFGLWQVLPAPVAIGATGLAAAGLLFGLVPLRHYRAPSDAEARRRVEERSRFVHRPVETLADHHSADPNDAEGQRLWAAHVERARDAVHAAKTGRFEPDVAKSDPWALRIVPALLLFIAVLFAQGDAGDRLRAMVDPRFAAPVTEAKRIDAWVTPPVYTGEPPLFLTQAQAGDNDTPGASTRRYSIPQNSVLTVRVTPGDGVELVSGDQGEPTQIEAARPTTATNASAPATFETEVETSTAFRLLTEGQEIRAWAFDIVPDTPPEIAFLEPPQQAISGALTLSYFLRDDYGVTAAEAEVAQIAPDGDAGRPLFEAPELPLMLPQARVRDGEASTTRDLQAHPWAGSRVSLTLKATDEAGQIGHSEPHLMTLPERTFHNPLARAIVEQRRVLALNGDAIVPVTTALDALSYGADRFFDDANHYLLLRSAYWRLQNADTDDELRGVVGYLWDIALYIEDGDLSVAERRLRDAQQALMDALEDGASDAEIERLMSELRQAMADFLRELAENAEQMPQGAEMPPLDPSQMLSSQDLDRMLDQIENMARSGARDAARQLLAEMQRMMENLRNARRMPQNMQGDGQMSEALQQLQEMIQRQQELMDQTFRLDQQGPQNGQPQQGQPGQQPQPGQGLGQSLQDQLNQLGQGQQALREQLEELMRQLGEMGMGNNESLGQAGEAMGRAEGNLRGEQPGQAVGDQGEALSNLRAGTQSMMESMMEAEGQDGENGNPLSQRDPLGRPQRTEGPDLGNTVKVPDEIDVQRAREILQELRRRLSEPQRPKIERDYLERLITPY